MVDNHSLPPVEDMPVLPDLRSDSDVDLSVSEQGKIYIFHEKAFPEDVEYILYESDTHALSLIAESGRMQNIGMYVHPPIHDKIIEASEVFLVLIQNKKVVSTRLVMLMVQ